jgi:hypothetical protein
MQFHTDLGLHQMANINGTYIEVFHGDGTCHFNTLYVPTDGIMTILICQQRDLEPIKKCKLIIQIEWHPKVQNQWTRSNEELSILALVDPCQEFKEDDWPPDITAVDRKVFLLTHNNVDVDTSVLSHQVCGFIIKWYIRWRLTYGKMNLNQKDAIDSDGNVGAKSNMVIPFPFSFGYCSMFIPSIFPDENPVLARRDHGQQWTLGSGRSHPLDVELPVWVAHPTQCDHEDLFATDRVLYALLADAGRPEASGQRGVCPCSVLR